MKIGQYHKSLETLHINTEKPRAYFIPFDCVENALSGERENSPYFLSLCGKWNFEYFRSFDEITEDALDESCVSKAAAEVDVPGITQLYGVDGVDVPLYSNLMYPFPTDPPFVPDENPAAIFCRDFEIPEENADREQIITFEGVASCFYLYINGEFVGYSQISHSTSEFNITKFIRPGKNRIAVLNVKWCDGSYLEDQDFFRLSGIFREVYILSRSKTRLCDVQIKQSFADDFSKATLAVTAELTKEEPILYGLASPDGSLIASGESESSDFSIEIPSPVLWNDETPYVYQLFITVDDEIVPFQIALVKKEIKDKKLLINGKPVKLKGINRHDSSARGYVVTVDEMKRDLLLMKKANVNAIRTSHYPNDPRFVILAEALGFYLIDEADIETHGMGYNNVSDWDWMRWSQLSTVDEWEDAYVDRAAYLYERDKNSGCVVMWSLGNESGCGKNHRAMRKYIKSRDEKAIVHYENAHLEFKAVPEGENFSDISDVESRMYAGTTYIKNYLENGEYSKPFYMCEYVCSMSTGDVYDYWKLVDEYDNFCGGCIWEWCDHALNIPAEDGSPRYYYGGDFGDFPNDGICCIDGLVLPDRTPRPGYFDMKKCYEPFRGSYENGSVKIKNVRYFTALSDFYIDWKIETGGIDVLYGKIEKADIPPQEEKTFALFDENAVSKKPDTFLTLSFRYAAETPWSKIGDEAGFLQFELSEKVDSEKPEEIAGTVKTKEDERFILITCGKNEFVFDKNRSAFNSIKRDGKEFLAAPSKFNIWHAPTYNRGSVDEWLKNHFDHCATKTYSAATESCGDTVTLRTKISLGAPAMPPFIKANVDYIFLPDGSFDIVFSGDVRENLPCLPRLGLEFILKDENEDIKWFGLGETESYPDRYLACRYGMYEKTVTDNFFRYIRPQENSSHYKTRVAFVGIKGEKALQVKETANGDFSFNASHYSSEQLTKTKHDFELREEPFTYFDIDARFNGISENGELANSENKRIFNDKHVEFRFNIKPTEF